MRHQEGNASHVLSYNGSTLLAIGETQVHLKWQGIQHKTIVNVVIDPHAPTRRYTESKETSIVGDDTFVIGQDLAERHHKLRSTSSPNPSKRLMCIMSTIGSQNKDSCRRGSGVQVPMLVNPHCERTYVQESLLHQIDVHVDGGKVEQCETVPDMNRSVVGKANVCMQIGQCYFNISVLALRDFEGVQSATLGRDATELMHNLGHTFSVESDAKAVKVGGVRIPFMRQKQDGEEHVVCSTGKALRVQVTVNNHELEALFDTGASLTILGRPEAEQLGLSLNRSEARSASTANGSRMFFEGSTYAKIQLRNRSIWYKVYVAQERYCPAPLVMGMDLIRLLAPDEVKLNFKSKKVQFEHDELDFVNALLDEKLTKSNAFLRLKVPQDLLLKPRSDNFIEAEFCETPIEGQTYLVTERPHRYSVMVGRSLHAIIPEESRKTFIRVLNSGNNEVLIRANSVIAQAEQVAPEDITDPIFEVNAVVTETDVNEDIRQLRSMQHRQDRTRRIGLKRLKIKHRRSEWNENKQRLWEAKLDRELDLRQSILTPAGKVILRNILNRHGPSFVQDDGVIGKYCGPIEATIDLQPNAKPIRQRPRRIPHMLEPVVLKQLQTWYDQQAIQTSNSPYASPIVVVGKSGGTEWRTCIDYRLLNAQMQPATYIIPLMTDLIDKVAGHKYYSSFDIASAFTQVPVKEEDVYKTAFVTPYGQFECLRLPFGIKNGPLIMTRVMEDVRRYLTSSTFIYIDDCCLVADSEHQHLKDLDQFFNVLERFNLKLRFDKSFFCRDEVRYLGVLVSEKGIKPDPRKVAAIKLMKQPKNLTELRGVIGAFSYWRRFLPNFARIMAPLYALTRNEGKITDDKGRIIGIVGRWTPECQNAFDTIIELLSTAPVLAAPWIGHEYIIEFDASKVAFGACLMQRGKDGLVHPIYYASKLTNKSQAKFPSVELEAAALVWSVLFFAPYITGCGVTTVRTDNSALCSLMKKKDSTLTGRLLRYQMAIQGFDLNIVHRSGTSNRFADYLSRYPGAGAQPPEPEDKPAANKAETTAEVTAVEDIEFRLTPARIHHEQMRDENLRTVYNAIVHHKYPKDSAERRLITERLAQHTVKNDVIHRADKDGQVKIVLPHALRERIITDIHGDPLEGAHLGVTKTYEKVARRYIWNGMRDDVSSIVRSCGKCMARKSPPTKLTTEPIHRWPPAVRPNSRVHADIGGPYVRGDNNFTVVLITIDALTKWATASPLRRQTSELIAEAFERDLICQRGSPETLVTDRGQNLLSETFAKLSHLYGFKHYAVSAYHQQSNGQVERFMHVLANMLACYVNKQGTNWPKYVYKVVHAYNTSIHATTGQSPFYLSFLREAWTRTDLRLSLFEGEQVFVEGEVSEAEKLRKRCEELARVSQTVWTAARDAIETKEILRNLYEDERRHAKPHGFKVQQLVLRYVHQVPEEQRHKFRPYWNGPYRILKLAGPNATIKPLAEGNQKEITLHVDHLKPFAESITLPLHSGDAPRNDSDGTDSDSALGQDQEQSEEEEGPEISPSVRA